jgi:3',5'-cyclic AMP phosphodiesterase CpdA
MPSPATFLHVTDPHLTALGSTFARDDLKVRIPEIAPESREGVLELLFSRLAARLQKENRHLDGVLFSGDAQDRGLAGGHDHLLKLLLANFGPLGITPGQIVATPGNHDIPRGVAPSSVDRYQPFTSVWGTAGCVVPWLDGVDKPPVLGHDGPHQLLDADRRWVVYTVNTCNWSHVTSVLPEPLQGVWASIPGLVAKGDAEQETMLRSQLEALARYDMARVSKYQLEALRTIVESTPQPLDGRQLRIAIMHHHLRSPSLREEVKPFADISNLEQVRAFLRDSGIEVVVHGHKHEYANHFDHISTADGESEHRTLVISGATYEIGRETDAVRLITVSGLPYTPEIEIEPIALPRSGVETPRAAPIVRRLWAMHAEAGGPVVIKPGVPMVVEGSDLDEVYTRACKLAAAQAKGGTLVVHLDLPVDDGAQLPLPSDYPVPEPLAGDERQMWLEDLVTWWQRGRSTLEHRISYIHGARLRRYGGKIDQLQRIIRLLRAKPTTRAVWSTPFATSATARCAKTLHRSASWNSVVETRALVGRWWTQLRSIVPKSSSAGGPSIWLSFVCSSSRSAKSSGFGPAASRRSPGTPARFRGHQHKWLCQSLTGGWTRRPNESTYSRMCWSIGRSAERRSATPFGIGSGR